MKTKKHKTTVKYKNMSKKKVKDTQTHTHTHSRRITRDKRQRQATGTPLASTAKTPLAPIQYIILSWLTWGSACRLAHSTAATQGGGSESLYPSGPEPATKGPDPDDTPLPVRAKVDHALAPPAVPAAAPAASAGASTPPPPPPNPTAPEPPAERVDGGRTQTPPPPFKPEEEEGAAVDDEEAGVAMVAEEGLLPRRWSRDSARRVALWERIEWRFDQAASSERQRTAGRDPAMASDKARAPHPCYVLKNK